MAQRRQYPGQGELGNLSRFSCAVEDAWWVLPAALQRWSSKLLNPLLLFIPEQSGTERPGHASFSASPSHPDADAGADVAAEYTQMWHHPCTCCAAGE